MGELIEATHLERPPAELLQRDRDRMINDGCLNPRPPATETPVRWQGPPNYSVVVGTTKMPALPEMTTNESSSALSIWMSASVPSAALGEVGSSMVPRTG